MEQVLSVPSCFVLDKAELEGRKEQEVPVPPFPDTASGIGSPMGNLTSFSAAPGSRAEGDLIFPAATPVFLNLGNIELCGLQHPEHSQCWLGNSTS